MLGSRHLSLQCLLSGVWCNRIDDRGDVRVSYGDFDVSERMALLGERHLPHRGYLLVYLERCRIASQASSEHRPRRIADALSSQKLGEFIERGCLSAKDIVSNQNAIREQPCHGAYDFVAIFRRKAPGTDSDIDHVLAILETVFNPASSCCVQSRRRTWQNDLIGLQTNPQRFLNG